MTTAERSSFDVEATRRRFPALSSGALFFDNPGGTQVPLPVLEAVDDYLRRRNSNLGGAFATSRASDRTLEEGRGAMADLLNGSPQEIVFGPNMTSLTFALSRSLGRELEPGDELVVTRLDHDANVSPWLAVAEDRGLEVRFVDFSPEDCTLRLDHLESLLGDRTRLVAVGYASNAVGTVNPIRRVAELAHRVGALCFVDAVHYAPHGLIDVEALGCDFLALSAYKFFGPHIGILWGKHEHLKRLRPYKVRPASDEVPERWESGTLDHEGIAGATAAVEYLAGLGRGDSRRERLVTAMANVRAYEMTLSRRLLEALSGIAGVELYGISDPERLDERVPTVAFTVEGMSPRQVAEELGRRDIYVWDGNYYALEVMRALGLEDRGGMVRVGLVHYNLPEEIEVLAGAFDEIL